MDAHLSAIFPSSTGNALFGDNLSKKPNKQTNKYENWKVWYSLHVHVFEWKIPFLGRLGPKNKIVSLIRNLVPRLIRICRIQ